MFFPPPQNPPAGPSNSSSNNKRQDNGQGNGNQRLSAPPSRLSPPPGTSVQDLLASTEISSKGKKKKEDTPKRGYRACVHCRLRKARCDLGDVNSPSEPPCTRCRREQRNCVFLPSKRRRKTQGDEDDNDRQSLDPEEHEDWKPALGLASSSTLPQQPSQVNQAFLQAQQNSSAPNWPANFDTKTFDTSLFNLPQSQTNVLGNQNPAQLPNDNATPASLPSVQSVQSHAESSNSGYSPNTRKRRREGDGARRIVVASFSNETDALEILANAATDDKKDQYGGSSEQDRSSGRKVSFEDKVGARLDEFVLVKQRILDVTRLELLIRIFFEHHHPALPVFQTARIPRSNAQLALLCRTEPFLMSVLVAVASAHHPDAGMKEIHERTWAVIRDAIEDYTFSGSATSVGFVEGVLLLAENLPREVSKRTSELLSGGEDSVGLHGTENRRSWALTGLAIRAAYGLGLDQIAIEINEAERTADLERARSTWTWCYLYDRTIGLRTGLAFWSRGPSLCFVGYSHISQTGERAAVSNFPYMLNHGPASPSADNDTDSASLMQSLVELTQIMTNAHDILYPSKTRTDILVRQGEYFKFLDSFHRALQSFKSVWSLKTWKSDSLEQLCWCTFHFVRLYVSSFAFQAHVQRAQARAEGEAGSEGKGEGGKEKNVQLFPRGSATSPDALYIYESIDAATEILQTCLRLGQMGVLRYLPSRYLMNFVYGGVFALKAGYSGATSQKDMTKTREMVDRVCAVLVLACPDRDHAASRYGQMLRMLSKKLEQLDASAVPSRFPSPEPQPMSDLPVDIPWNIEIPSQHTTLQNPFQMTPISSGMDHFQMNHQAHNHLNNNHNNHSNNHNQTQDNFDPFAGLPNTGGADELFNNFDMDVQFDLDGFWEDFTLGEGSGFPFR